MRGSNNAIQIIRPYCHGSMWQFDDEAKGLRGEAFVSGAGEMMDYISRDIEDAKQGFNLIFSEHAFPSHTLMVEQVTVPETFIGTHYYHKDTEHLLWLCPALLHYFKIPPQRIYAEAKPIKKGRK